MKKRIKKVTPKWALRKYKIAYGMAYNWNI